MYNDDDYSIKKRVSMSSASVSKEIAFYERLDAPKLIEVYEKGQLKGQLKEIAAELDEESNPVIMLVKQKK